MPVTPNQAKKLLKGELERLQLPFTKLTAKTVGFQDLARDSKVFVTVHGWQANPAWEGLESFAKQNGFCVSAAGHF